MIVLNRPFRFCNRFYRDLYSSGLQITINRAQLSGSDLAAVTMTNRTQMITSLIRIIVADAMKHSFTSRNAGKILTCIVRYNAHIEMNSSLQEPIRQVQKKEKDKRHSLNKLNTFNSLSNKNICLTFRTI